MMHSQAIPVLDYHGECRQVGAVGGDFYMFLPLSSDRLAFAIGDASGKGLPAALMSASVQASLRTALMLAGDDPALMMSAINRHLYDVSLPERYATLFYGVIERSTLRLRYVNAGHSAPLVVRADGSAVWLREGGAPVGLFATADYDLGLVDLRPDDVLLAYTDGVTESVNRADEEFGEDGLVESARQNRHRSAQAITDLLFEAVDAFATGAHLDDLTLLTIRMNASGDVGCLSQRVAN